MKREMTVIEFCSINYYDTSNINFECIFWKTIIGIFLYFQCISTKYGGFPSAANILHRKIVVIEVR